MTEKLAVRARRTDHDVTSVTGQVEGYVLEPATGKVYAVIHVPWKLEGEKGRLIAVDIRDVEVF